MVVQARFDNSLVFAIEGMCRSHSLTMTARLNGVAFDLDRIGSSHLISLLLLGVEDEVPL